MAWAKGQSGNPTGRPPETIEVREVRRLAQAKSERAFQVIDSILENADAKEGVRLAAALAILRLAGVPMNVVPMTPTDPEETPELTPTELDAAESVAAQGIGGALRQ